MFPICSYLIAADLTRTNWSDLVLRHLLALMAPLVPGGGQLRGHGLAVFLAAVRMRGLVGRRFGVRGFFVRGFFALRFFVRRFIDRRFFSLRFIDRRLFVRSLGDLRVVL